MGAFEKLQDELVAHWFPSPTVPFRCCLWLWVNRWGWVFPWSIFNPRLNLKRFQRSLQTIVSVISKQISPLPPFVFPHLSLLSSHSLNLRVCWLSLPSETVWVHPQLQKQGSHPKSSRGPHPSFCVCVCIPTSRRDRQRSRRDSQIQGAASRRGNASSHYPSFLCVDSSCLLGPQGSMQRGFTAISPHSHICQRPLAGSFPSPYINKREGEHPCKFHCGYVSESCQGCSCHI